MKPQGKTRKAMAGGRPNFTNSTASPNHPQADKQNIAHVIDVLSGSNPQIPAPWAEKLDILKQHCAAN